MADGLEIRAIHHVELSVDRRTSLSLVKQSIDQGS